MAVVMTILQIAAIVCMLICIGFLILCLGLGPRERIVKFLKEHYQIQAMLGIVVAIGIIASIIAIM